MDRLLQNRVRAGSVETFTTIKFQKVKVRTIEIFERAGDMKLI